LGRILAIDYGLKRVGLATTDPEQIIATALTTIPAREAVEFIRKYCQKENVTEIVVGLALDLRGNPTDSTPLIDAFVLKLKAKIPKVQIFLHDERYTSKMALDAMIRGGSKKSQRQNKENIDKISATIILQSFLESRKYRS